MGKTSQMELASLADGGWLGLLLWLGRLGCGLAEGLESRRFLVEFAGFGHRTTPATNPYCRRMFAPNKETEKKVLAVDVWRAKRIFWSGQWLGKCFVGSLRMKVGGLGMVERQEGRVAFLFEEAFYGLRWVWCVFVVCMRRRAFVFGRAAFSRRDCWGLRRSPNRWLFGIGWESQRILN